MKEQQIELRATKLAKAMGWIVHKLDSGDGVPDRIYVKQGRVFYVEWKKQGTGVISKDQKKWAVKIKDNGTPHFFMDNEEQIRKVLIQMERRWFSE